MDDGEWVTLFVAGLVAASYWSKWYRRAAATFSPRCRPFLRGTLLAAPILLCAAFPFILHVVASSNVRNVPEYLILFTVVAAVALALGDMLAVAVELGPIDHGIAGSNGAVAIAALGIWIGVMLLNVGSNIGEGGTIDTTLIPLAGSLVAFSLWVCALAWLTRWPAAASSARNYAAGNKFLLFSVSGAAWLARADAGDWHSLRATADDLTAATPGLAVLAAAAWLLERILPSR